MARTDVDAVVLVGGKGTRLRPLTLSAPKPMLPTAGVPFLEHQLSRIREAGISHVVLGTSYKAETFTEYFGDGSDFGLSIEYLVEDEPLGTGGAIRNVAPALRADTVMVFNGDILSGVDLGALLDTHTGNDADVTLHLVKVPDPRAFGSVPTDADGRVQAFLEKTDNPPTDQINAGCYVFKRSVLEAIPAGRVVSVERETFPGLLASGARVFGHVDTTYWLDLGTPAAFVKGSADLVTGIAPTAALPGARRRIRRRRRPDRRRGDRRPRRRSRYRGGGRRRGGLRRCGDRRRCAGRPLGDRDRRADRGRRGGRRRGHRGRCRHRRPLRADQWCPGVAGCGTAGGRGAVLHGRLSTGRAVAAGRPRSRDRSGYGS
jgi:dTDP-glucose pyrophosphorylase